MIEVKQISFRRKNKVVLSDVSLEVRGGQCLALMGPSGAGKTTLLRIIAGLERPESGEVELSGVKATSGSYVVPPESRGISMIFQSLALWPHMTVAQHIGFVESRNGGIGKAILARMQLAGKERRYPDQLSGGEKQRLAIARALASEPKCLLLDEPFSNLDEILRKDLLSLFLEQTKKHDIASILITHNVDEALDTADSMAVLAEGRIKRSWINKKNRAITRNEILDCFYENGYGK